MSKTQLFSMGAEAEFLLKRAGSDDPSVAIPAQKEIATAAAEIIRDGVLDGDIISNIFMSEPFTNDFMRIDLDLLAPGTENEHIAYTMPDHGRIAHRQVEGDYIMLNTYRIASSIDVTRKYFRNARYDVLRRMMEVLQASFTKKKNDDGWQTLLAAADGRGIVVYDADAAAGVFTPKLVSLMKTVMRRNGGGNSSSINRKKLTDIFLSPEGFEDMSAWQLNLVSDDIRTQIFRSPNGSINNVYGVNLHDIDELGAGQEYQLYYTGTLAGSLGGSDTDLVVGLDLTAKDKAFLMPVTQDVQVYEDPTMHRSGLVSFYGDAECGFACLDVRYVLAGSF